MSPIVAILIRVPPAEIERLLADPAVLPKYDVRVPLGDGRAIDLGRSWESLGCLLEGGVQVPEQGPTVGEEPLPDTDRYATWSYVPAPRVRVIAGALRELAQRDFKSFFRTDSDDTADNAPEEHTGVWSDQATYLMRKLRLLARHYTAAAEHTEAILVRIGERP